MNRQDIVTEKLRVELIALGTELEKLKLKAAEAKLDGRDKMNVYLETLEQKREAVVDRLDALKDSGDDAIDDIILGLKEAKQRLAIAKKAAKARFH